MKPIIRTYTGKQINPFNIDPKEIDILDIAHGLSLCNRFAGHTMRPISVAQHSVYVSRLCARESLDIQLQALLHDASEAYLGDVTKWVKQTPEMKKYREVENNLENLIYLKFGCPLGKRNSVDYADKVMVRFEANKGFGKDFQLDHHGKYPPLTKEEIERVGPWGFWSWKQAKESFLDHFRLLTNE